MSDYRRTLLNVTIDGHRVLVEQEMYDAAIRPDWEGQGPFVPGLLSIQIDGAMATREALIDLLTACDRELARQLP